MNKEFPNLHDFFGAYFHQDWTAEHDTAEQVIESFRRESEQNDRLMVREELKKLLSQNIDEMTLRKYLLKELSCYFTYWNEWDSGKHWLQHIDEQLIEEL
ncbi:hypothetical protein GIW70_26235 [Pseudomonas syringae]|nr:hypothetical protein [Pseudomonas syringae]